MASQPARRFETPRRHLSRPVDREIRRARELFGTKKNGAWQWTTYAEFGAHGRRVPRRPRDARRRSAATRSRVIANNRVEWAVAAYACFGLGAAFVPMYEAQHDKEWEFIVQDCEAKVLVVANEGDPRRRRTKFFEDDPVARAHHRASRTSATSDGPSVSTTQRCSPRKQAERRRHQARAEGHARPHLHERHDRQPEGRHPLAREHRVERQRGARDLPDDGDDRSLSFLPWAHSFGQTCELHGLFSSGASHGALRVGRARSSTTSPR